VTARSSLGSLTDHASFSFSFHFFIPKIVLQAVVKATYPDDFPPKDKHVRNLEAYMKKYPLLNLVPVLFGRLSEKVRTRVSLCFLLSIFLSKCDFLQNLSLALRVRGVSLSPGKSCKRRSCCATSSRATRFLPSPTGYACALIPVSECVCGSSSITYTRSLSLPSLDLFCRLSPLPRQLARQAQRIGSLSRFSDEGTFVQSSFIRRYAVYVQEKLFVYVDTKHNRDRFTPKQNREWYVGLVRPSPSLDVYV
jgi:hypothetical protein